MPDTLFLNACINIFQLSCILMYMHEKPLVAFLSLARLKTFLPKRPEMGNPNLVNMCPNSIRYALMALRSVFDYVVLRFKIKRSIGWLLKLKETV